MLTHSTAWAKFRNVSVSKNVWECRAFDLDGPSQWFADATKAELEEYSDPDKWRIVPCLSPRLGDLAYIVDGRPQWL